MSAPKTISILSFAALTFASLPTAHATFSSKIKGDRLILTQTADSGAVVLDNNGGGGAFRVTDAGTTTFVVANSVTLILLDNSNTSLTIDFDNPVVRDVRVDVGKGVRQINFTGSSNVMGGHLEILGTNGAQTVELGVNAGLQTADLTIDLGIGFDIVEEDNSNTTVIGDMLFRGVNFFENNGEMLVTGDVVVNVAFEPESTQFDDDNNMTLMGNFTFVGGPGRDEITLNGVGTTGTVISGDVKIDLKGSSSGTQFALPNLPKTRIGGDLIVKAGKSPSDSFGLNPSAIVGGRIMVDLSNGVNDAVFAGRGGGKPITYKGGSGIDTVTFGMVTRGSTVKINTGSGADIFNLNAGTNVNKLTVNLGGGVDNFVDAFGDPKPFKFKIKNLP